MALVVQVAVIVAVAIGLLLFGWALLKAGKRGEVENERLEIASNRDTLCVLVYSVLRRLGPCMTWQIRDALADLGIRVDSSRVDAALAILESERLVRRRRPLANPQVPYPCWELNPDRDKE